MSDPKDAPPEQPDEAEDSDSGFNVTRWTMIITGAVTGVIVLIFLLSVGLAIFADSIYWAPRFQIIRDSFLVIMTLEIIMIIVAIAALIIQIARLVNLLQSETKPVLDNAQETLNTAKTTTQFVGRNLAEPIIKFQSFLAGLFVFMRELGGIRRAIRKHTKSNGDK